MAKAQANTLGFAGDGDDSDFILAVQEAFGVTLAQDELDRILTIGDVQDVLVEKLGPAGGSKCATQMAFLRLRAALAQLQPGIRLGPSTPMNELTRLSPKALWKHIRHASGLALPSLQLGAVGGAGALLFLGGFVALVAVALGLTPWSLVLLPAGILMLRIDRGRYGDIATLGDLSKRCTTRNYGKLAALGARSSAAAIWDALTEIAAFHSESDCDGINREATLFQRRYVGKTEAA